MKFNKSQEAAISHRQGPMLVLAGPGSGKTTVIARRIQYLIEECMVNPANILVITFTKAAAGEMKNRFFCLMEEGQDRMGGKEGQRSGAGCRNVTFGTFHAVFFTILKHAYHFSASNIIREEERYAIVKGAVLKRRIETEDEREFAGNVLGEIGRVKSERIDPANYYSSNCPADAFREIYQEYQETLKKNRLIDFEDMLVYTYELLTERPDILRAWQEKFRYILVDEFQDINRLQYDTVRLLAAPENNLFIVGDDDQSIYGFRGSKPEIMLNFRKDYPKAEQVLLDVNYRSTPEIAAAAGRVIRFNTKRYRKEISTVNPSGEPVAVYHFKDFIDEYRQIAEKIREMGTEEPKSYGSIAVLYRAAGGIGSLVRKLMEYNIPFQIKDKLPDIFEHWIAKDIFAYIRLACGRGNRNDFLQIVNKPKRYIGRDYLTDSEIDLDRLQGYYEEKPWIGERIEKLKTDLAMISGLNPYAAVNFIRRGVGYDEYLSEYAQSRHIQMDELLEVLNEIQESAREQNSFEEWEEAILAYRSRVKEQENTTGDRVTLTTMHSSKGLEFETVFIVDVNEGVCPHKKAVLDTDIEEERRMLYVAMTRAKKALYIYTTMERYGKKTEASRFLAEAGLIDPKQNPQGDKTGVRPLEKERRYSFTKPYSKQKTIHRQ